MSAFWTNPIKADVLYEWPLGGGRATQRVAAADSDRGGGRGPVASDA